MSLEAQIEALTAAVVGLTETVASLKSQPQYQITPAPAEAADASAETPKSEPEAKPKAKAKRSTKKKPKAEAPATPAAAADPEPKPKPESEPEPEAMSEEQMRAELRKAEAEEEAEDRANEAAGVVTINHVREALMDLATATDRNTVVELLGSYGAEKLGDISEADFADFISDARQKIDQAKEAA